MPAAARRSRLVGAATLLVTLTLTGAAPNQPPRARVRVSAALKPASPQAPSPVAQRRPPRRPALALEKPRVPNRRLPSTRKISEGGVVSPARATSPALARRDAVEIRGVAVAAVSIGLAMTMMATIAMANAQGVPEGDGGLMALLSMTGQGNELFNFNPVCPASDGVFRLGQRTAVALAGDQNVDDYRPLINDVLIRVRTELCVLESFMRETALPFIQRKGVGWILPVHETSETYVAGVVFVIGANFILLGSTKILAILSIYHDILLGFPSRAFGGFLDFAARGGVARDADEKKLKKLLDKQFSEVKKAMERSDGSAKVSEISERYARKIEALQESQAQVGN
uniref:Uncharacterized protein n=1 Tax=Lotharella globosa TaxID=91324 RepID=A0A7S3Z1Q8_9EUKA